MASAHQLNVLLYPYHSLAPLPDAGQPNARAIETAATLLYFETVTVGRLGDPGDMELGSPEEALEEVERIKQRRGARAVSAFNQEGKFSGLNLEEVAALSFVRYWYDVAKFHKNYGSLIDADVVRPVSLTGITNDLILNAESVGSDIEWLNMKSVLAGFVAKHDAFKRWPNNRTEREIFEAALLDADGLGMTCWYLRAIIGQTNPALLQSEDVARQGEFFREAFLLDVHHQTVLSAILALPIVSFDEAHLKLRGNYAAKLSTTLAAEEGMAGLESLAIQLVAETLGQMPTIMPRSTEAILELRQTLAEELAEFRQGIRNAASDLIHASGPITQKLIAYTVEKNFARPLDNLTRRLAHPNRELLRSLLTTPAAMGGAVSFAVASIGTGGNLLSLFAAAAGAVLSAAAKARIDRKKDVEQSGVAFLLRAGKK